MPLTSGLSGGSAVRGGGSKGINILVTLMLIDQISAALAKTAKAVTGFGAVVTGTSTKSSGASKAITGFGAAFTAVGATIGAGIGTLYAAEKAFDALMDIGERGAAFQQTTLSFGQMMEAVGVAPGMLDKLREASRGTISDMQLMSYASTALAGSVGVFGQSMADALPEILEVAKAANKANPALGSVDYQFQSLIVGLKRLSPRLIDNTGLQIKLGAAYEVLAKKLGKTREELTAEDQQLALLNATLDAGRKLMSQVGGNADSLTDSFGRLRASGANLGNMLATEFTPGAKKGADMLSYMIDKMVIWQELLDRGLVSRPRAGDVESLLGPIGFGSKKLDELREMIDLVNASAVQGQRDYEGYVDTVLKYCVVAGLMTEETAKIYKGNMLLDDSTVILGNGMILFSRQTVEAANSLNGFRDEGDLLARPLQVSAELVTALDEAAGGLIPTAKLASLALFAAGNGSEEFKKAMQDALPEIIRISAAVAEFNPALGNTENNILDLVRGIKTLNPDMIALGGVTIDVKQAFADYAGILYVSVDALTSEQRSQAILNAILKVGITLLEDLALKAKMLESRWDSLLKAGLSGEWSKIFQDADKATEDFRKGTADVGEEIAKLMGQENAAAAAVKFYAAAMSKEASPALDAFRVKTADLLVQHDALIKKLREAKKAHGENSWEVATYTRLLKENEAAILDYVSEEDLLARLDEMKKKFGATSPEVAALEEKLRALKTAQEGAAKAAQKAASQFMYEKLAMNLGASQALQLARAMGLLDEPSYAAASAAFALAAGFEAMMEPGETFEQFMAKCPAEFQAFIDQAVIAATKAGLYTDALNGIPTDVRVDINTYYNTFGKPPTGYPGYGAPGGGGGTKPPKPSPIPGGTWIWLPDEWRWYWRSDVPGKALGGTAAAGMSILVGEQGPELFTPTQSGYITPNNQITNMANNLGSWSGAQPTTTTTKAITMVSGTPKGTVINIYFNNTKVSSAIDLEVLAYRLASKIKSKVGFPQ